MTTGAVFSTLTLKSLMGFGDLNTRLLSYLQQLCVDTTKARWDVDGVFATKLTLSSVGASKFAINGSSRATDGQGHLLDVTQIEGGDTLYNGIMFENTLAATYYVALHYADVPDGVRINPRAGVPEYISRREEIGFSAAPNAVVSSSGNLTFTVDSVTEAGVSNAGRYVQVYKNIPGNLVTDDTLALPTPIAVAWDGTNNKITLTGTLGQSSPSTSAADYTVVLIGPSVKKNTDLRTAPGYCFVATVTGAGVANPPGAIDNSSQQLLVTFEDADIVRAELEAFEAALLSAATPGAGLVGVAPSSFGPRNPVDGGFVAAVRQYIGIGNQADSTMPPNPTLSQVLQFIERAILRARAFSATVSADNVANVADIIDGHLEVMVKTGGTLMLKHSSAAFQETGAYLAGASPHVKGETATINRARTPSQAALVNYGLNRGGARGSLQAGKYERLMLLTSVAQEMGLGGTGVTTGTIIQECTVGGSQMDIDGSDISAGLMPFHIMDTIFDPSVSTSNPLLSSVLSMGKGNAQKPAFGMMENCVVIGQPSAQTSPACVATLFIGSGLGAPTGLATALDLDPIGTGAGNQDKPLVFKNCLFIQQRVDTFLVWIQSKQKVVFENCGFYGITGMAFPLFKFDPGSHVVMRDCMAFAPEGQFFDGAGVMGLIDNLTMVAGVGTAVTTPQAIMLYGGAQRLAIKNSRLFVNTSCCKTAPGFYSPMVMLGSDGTTHGPVDVDGFEIIYKAGIGVHGGETLCMFGSAIGSSFRNVSIDFALNAPTAIVADSSGRIPSGLTSTLFGMLVYAISGDLLSMRPVVENLKIVGLNHPPSANMQLAIFAAQNADVKNLQIDVNWTGGTFNYFCYTALFDATNLDGFRFLGTTANVLDSIFKVYGNSVVADDIRLSSAEFTGNLIMGGSAPSAIVAIDGNDNQIDGISYSTTSTWATHIKLHGSFSSGNGWRINSTGSSASDLIELGTVSGTDKCLSVTQAVVRWHADTYNACIISAQHCILDGRFHRYSGTGGSIEVGGGSTSSLTTNTVLD